MLTYFKSLTVIKFCPRGYAGRFKSSCYKFVTARVSWMKAYLDCKIDGSDLVSFESAAENNYIRKFIKERPYLNNTSKYSVSIIIYKICNKNKLVAGLVKGPQINIGAPGGCTPVGQGLIGYKQEVPPRVTPRGSIGIA